MKKIYYFCPDFSPPSGGTKRLYRHVFHLNRHGFKAFIVHYKKGFKLTWHGFDVPVLWLEDNLNFKDEEVLVFPESMPSLMKQTKDFNCKRLVIALNWAYIFNSLPGEDNWNDYGVSMAITPSLVIKDFIQNSMSVDVTLIDSYINGEKFTYNPAVKKNKIVYLTRKDKTGETLRLIFKRKDNSLDTWEWTPLTDMNEDEYAVHLREAKIFLATSLQEGIPTSILEAMSSGCVVVGFPGVGGNDYMVGDGDKQNCIAVENGNLPELAKNLRQVLSEWDKNNHIRELIIKNGIQTAGQFHDLDKEGNCLKEYFQAL